MRVEMNANNNKNQESIDKRAGETNKQATSLLGSDEDITIKDLI